MAIISVESTMDHGAWPLIHLVCRRHQPYKGALEQGISQACGRALQCPRFERRGYISTRPSHNVGQQSAQEPTSILL